MIVRIATENQYRFPTRPPSASTSSTTLSSRRSTPATRTRFHEVFEEMLDLVRTEGTPLDDDDLEDSDVILPPPEPPSRRPRPSSPARA